MIAASSPRQQAFLPQLPKANDRPQRPERKSSTAHLLPSIVGWRKSEKRVIRKVLRARQVVDSRLFRQRVEIYEGKKGYKQHKNGASWILKNIDTPRGCL